MKVSSVPQTLMSPQMKRRLQLGTLYTALAVGAIGFGAKAAVQSFDERYVHTTVFEAYVSRDAQQHLADSLIADRKFQQVIDMLRRLDTTLRVCVRHQDTCR